MEYDPHRKGRYGDGMMYMPDGASGGERGGYASGGNNSRGTRGYRDGMIRRYDDGQISYSMYHEPMMGHIYRDGVMQDPRNMMIRDPREGRSGERRKMYMEGKIHKDKVKSMQDLEAYMQELATDMSEMIQDASPEEKQLLQNKIATLAAKVK
jgi:hypothetical protein